MAREDYVSFECAKLLKKKGFDEWCSYGITRFEEDFVYDGDPEHPESHRKGEVKIYNIHTNNKDSLEGLVAMPHLYDAQKWLRNKFGLCINIDAVFDKENPFFMATATAAAGSWMVGYGKNYEGTLLDAIMKALEAIKTKEEKQ